jgi:hypothetical protein
VFYKSAAQRITTRQQTVMRIRERKQWQKSEGLPASGAATAMDRNPIMMLIMRLLAAASVADDRLPLTYRASPQDLVAVLLPLSFKLVRRRRKWDKENRSRWGSAADVDLPRSESEAELLLLKIQSPQENKAFWLQVYRRELDRLDGYFRPSRSWSLSAGLSED